MIKLKQIQKNRLKAIDTQVEALNAQKQAYLISMLEFHEVGEKIYELSKDYDLLEKKKEKE